MEKWQEIYSKEQIRHIQNIEIKSLTLIKEICRKINVDFFLYGGSLLGAIRHKGFIPWDDDLDIAMLREDYNKFITIGIDYLPKDYILQTPYNDKHSPYPYTKLRLKGTKYVEYGYHRVKGEKGIYVDIYPIDNIPDDDNLYLKQFKIYNILSKMYAWRQCPYIVEHPLNCKLILKQTLKYIISIILKLIPQKYFIELIDNISKKYNNNNTYRKGNYNFPKPVNYFVILLPYKEGTLNNIHLKLPK